MVLDDIRDPPRDLPNQAAFRLEPKIMIICLWRTAIFLRRCSMPARQIRDPIFQPAMRFLQHHLLELLKTRGSLRSQLNSISPHQTKIDDDDQFVFHGSLRNARESRALFPDFPRHYLYPERNCAMASFSSDNISSPERISVALLIVRVACGLPFLYHGSAILFGAFGGPGPHGFAAFMHAPDIVGYLVGLAQFGGALAILSGILIRVGAACVLVVMLGAIFLVHLPHGYEVSKGGTEYALSLLLISLSLLISGGGAYSLNPMLPEGLRKL
jgi:putative oxidoreductase